MNIKKKIKDLEKEEAKLARERKSLSDQLKNVEALEGKLDALVKNSGYKNARVLVDALIGKYSLRMGKRKAAAAAAPAPAKAPRKKARKAKRKVAVKTARKRVAKKAAKAAAAPAKARRKRTKITAGLRDTVLKALKDGTSKNAASKKFALSYAVVTKMEKGVYSSLKSIPSHRGEASFVTH